MNSHLRPYNQCISNISTNIYLGLDFLLKNNLFLEVNAYIITQKIVKISF